MIKDIADLDLASFLKHQWNMTQHASFSVMMNEEEDDKELNDDDSFQSSIGSPLPPPSSERDSIELQYPNVSALVKQWITSDRRHAKESLVNDDREEMLFSLIRQRLDDNSKYDILEFIPTYSRWSLFNNEHDENYYAHYLRTIKYHDLEEFYKLKNCHYFH